MYNMHTCSYPLHGMPAEEEPPGRQRRRLVLRTLFYRWTGGKSGSRATADPWENGRRTPPAYSVYIGTCTCTLVMHSDIHACMF